MYGFCQGHHHFTGKAVEGIAHHGVSLIQGIRTQVSPALKDLRANCSDVGRAECSGQKCLCSVVIECRCYVSVFQLKICDSGPQAGATGGCRFGTEQGAQSAGEVILALPGVLQHEVGSAAFCPAQRQFVGNKLVCVEFGAGEPAVLDGFCL